MTEIKNVVIKFDYNIEQLNEIKSELSNIDRTNIEQIDEATKKLVKIRRAIQTKGKSYRDEANAFNKSVLQKEKEYLEIIEPLEAEYKELLEKEKERQKIEARKELLPNKKKQLSVLKIEQPTDEEILGMDEKEWVEFYDRKFAEHEANLEAERRAEQEEKERKEREEQIKKEAEERARREAEEALKQAEEEKKKAVEQAQKEAEEKARKEKEAEEERLRNEAEEKKKLEASKKYQEWLRSLGWTEETKDEYYIMDHGHCVELYKLLGKYDK